MTDSMKAKKRTGVAQVREALEAGEALTALDAYYRWGVQHLAGTIGHLKRQGMAINSQRVEVMNRAGDVCHVAQYSLASGKGPAMDEYAG